jgi:transposase-like protein
VAQTLLDNLIERKLKIDSSLVLFVIDGSKALRKAVKQTFGKGVHIQRCHAPMLRERKGHLPKGLHTSRELTMRQAYQRVFLRDWMRPLL